MKRILHIFRISQFTGGFFNAVRKWCINSEHIFWVYFNGLLTGDEEYLYEDNVQYILSVGHELRKPCIETWFDTFDKIIFHGIFDASIIRFFADKDNLLDKLYLYFWGGDIPLVGCEDDKLLKKMVVQRAKEIITIIDSDYRKLKGIYQLTGQKIVLGYLNDQVALMEKLLNPISGRCHDEVYIQIGNSATETNAHIEILEILQKFKEENIRILMPLAYGDKEYAKKVTEYGKEIFGEKVLIISEYLPLEKYIAECISQIDIGIFAMDRQQALGNICMLGLNGSKLYFKRDSQLDDYFRSELKCEIYYIDDIKNQSFEEFRKMALEVKKKNAIAILGDIKPENRVKRWNTLFEE